MHSERFTTPLLGGVELHVLHRGDPSAPALVLLHGGGANAHWWDDLASELAGRFRIAALDFRGHGDSDHPEALEPGAFERDLEALLEHLGAPDAALMGHSMGGHVALAVAARNAATRAVVAVEVSRGGGRRDRRRTRLALLARRTYRSREQALAHYRLLPATPRAPEELRLRLAGQSVRQEPDGRWGFKFDPRWFTLAASRPDLSQLRAPTLVVRGEESPLLTSAGAEALAGEIPGARQVEIAEAGHNVHLEQPRRFLEIVGEFLSRHLGSGETAPS